MTVVQLDTSEACPCCRGPRASSPPKQREHAAPSGRPAERSVGAALPTRPHPPLRLHSPSPTHTQQKQPTPLPHFSFNKFQSLSSTNFQSPSFIDSDHQDLPHTHQLNPSCSPKPSSAWHLPSSSHCSSPSLSPISAPWAPPKSRAIGTARPSPPSSTPTSARPAPTTRSRTWPPMEPALPFPEASAGPSRRSTKK